jgi:hypothetical protein
MTTVRKNKLEAPPLAMTLAVMTDLSEYWLFDGDYTLILAKRNPRLNPADLPIGGVFT